MFHSFVALAEAIFDELRAAEIKKPKAKRVNFTKNAIFMPFRVNWRALLQSQYKQAGSADVAAAGAGAAGSAVRVARTAAAVASVRSAVLEQRQSAAAAWNNCLIAVKVECSGKGALIKKSFFFVLVLHFKFGFSILHRKSRMEFVAMVTKCAANRGGRRCDVATATEPRGGARAQSASHSRAESARRTSEQDCVQRRREQ